MTLCDVCSINMKFMDSKEILKSDLILEKKNRLFVQIEPNNKPKMFATSFLSLDHAVVWWYMNYNIIDSELIKVYKCICSGKLTIALC